jgi:hypothetical protein
MKISCDLFSAFLKCSTKCWLRAAGEAASGNAYAEWVKSQNGSYHATQIERLLSETAKNEVVVSPPPERLRAAKWRLATNLVVRARMNTWLFVTVQVVKSVAGAGKEQERENDGSRLRQ